MYTRICTYPDSARTRQENGWNPVFMAKSQSQLFSHRYNLRSPKSHVWGFVNYNVLMTAYERPRAAAQRCCKAKRVALLGYHGSGVGSDIVSPSYDSTTETVQGCGLNVQCCLTAVYVQNVWSGWNDAQRPKHILIQLMYPMHPLIITHHHISWQKSTVYEMIDIQT